MSYPSFSTQQLLSQVQAYPALLRLLLLSDGTLTRHLTAYFNEDIAIELGKQKQIMLQQGCNILKAKPHEVVTMRDLSLYGVNSGRVYAKAQSYLITKRIPAELSKLLPQVMAGLGEALLQSGLETYRDVYAVEGDAQQVSRSYRIFIGSQPVMRIVESFDIQDYVQAAS